MVNLVDNSHVKLNDLRTRLSDSLLVWVFRAVRQEGCLQFDVTDHKSRGGFIWFHDYLVSWGTAEGIILFLHPVTEISVYV